MHFLLVKNPLQTEYWELTGEGNEYSSYIFMYFYTKILFYSYLHIILVYLRNEYIPELHDLVVIWTACLQALRAPHFEADEEVLVEVEQDVQAWEKTFQLGVLHLQRLS